MAREDDFDIDIDEKDTGRDDTDRDENDDEEEEKPKPADRDRLRNAVKATRKERDEARRELAEMRRKVAALEAGNGNSGSKQDDAERDRDADERAFARYRPTIVKAEAKGALVQAGAKPDRVARLVRLLDVDEISVDEKGNVDEDDLQAEVERVKEEWPELFRGDEEDDKPSRRPAGSRRVDGGRTGKPSAQTSTAKLAAALTGTRR